MSHHHYSGLWQNRSPPAAEQLRRAIEERGQSVRGLSKALAARPDVHATAESIRRSLARWLAGEQPIGQTYAHALEEELGAPEGTFVDYSFSRAITKAADLVRRLEAGEAPPPEILERVAAATELAGEAALRFADRLRREARALGSP